MIEFIHQRFAELAGQGVLAREHRSLKRRAQELVHSPTPVAGITNATESRAWRIDPSIQLDRDLVDQDGRVFYRAGTRVNPLRHRPLSKTLVFFDARDRQQWDWAMALNPGQRKKYVLVGGSPSEVMKVTEQPIYFDQRGWLSRRFGISHSPATVRQDGLQLRVEEHAL
jgi:conjugal transfer pilus assembly protein TraW